MDLMDDKRDQSPVSTLTESQSGRGRPVSPEEGAIRRERWYLVYGFFFKIRGLMVGLLLFAIFFTTRGSWGSDALNWSIGLPLFVGAWLLRIRSQQYLRYRLRDRTDLAMSGPYAYVRNPVYIANIVGIAALCILGALYWMVPITVAWAALVYHLAVRFEEMRLVSLHGERYLRYVDRVPRWFPRRSPATDADDSGRTGFWRAARVEWQNILPLLVPLSKMWTFHWHDGNNRAIFIKVESFILAHESGFLAIGGFGVVCLAAMNLTRFRSSQKKRIERSAKAEVPT